MLLESLLDQFFEKYKVDSFLSFPYMSTVQNRTEAFLTAEFEMGSGEPGSYDRPLFRTYR